MKFRNALIPSNRYMLIVVATILAVIFGAPAFSVDSSLTFKLDDNQREAQTETSIKVPPTKSARTPLPVVKGASAALIDVDTGQVLYAKSAHAKRPNASTTKMMTAILMIEHCKTDDIITASKNASETPYTSLHLKPGEKITMKDLLTGMLVRSANDAAVAAAEHISGSVPKFAELMNKKAAEIGCTDTHFVTPNGLYDPNHYSSAYDLCLIAKYGLQYPLFNEAVNTRKYTLSSRTLNKEDMVVYSRCKFLRNYPGADGVKSGYIKQARYCYVGSATRDGFRLVSAVLGSENSGNDTIAMMDYGFANFQPVGVVNCKSDRVNVDVNGGDKAKITALPVKDIQVTVPKTGATVTKRIELIPITAPITKGTKVGKMIASVNGTQVAVVELRAAEDVNVSFARRAWGLTKVCSVLAACLVLGGRFGRTFTKSTRRRRRGISSILRDFNNYR